MSPATTPDPMSLDQTLLVAPDVPFSRIQAALAQLGWSRDDRAAITPPMLPGEPELAGWTWRGRRPVITYTFNPVVRLRALDVGSLPPWMRAAIAEALPMLHGEHIALLLKDRDPRRALLGLFAARETERLDLAEPIGKLRHHAVKVVAEAAGSTHDALRRKGEAQIQVAALTRHMVNQALPLLRALREPNSGPLVRSLQPAAEDYARLFHADVADRVRAAYAALWRDPPVIDPGASYSEIDASAAPAGMFRWKNDYSWVFPQGYREIAGWLEPGRVWLRWRYRRPESTTGVAYDGLAWVGDRWVWCPKPYRILADILQEPVH